MQRFPEISVMKKLRLLARPRKAKMKSMLPVIAARLEIKSSVDDVAIGPKAKLRTQRLALRKCSPRISATPMKTSLSHTFKEVSRFSQLSSLL